MQRLLILIGIIVCKMLPLGVFAASQTPWGNGTHFCGVNDGQWNKRHSHQYRNRHYARSFAANLNAGEPRTVRMIYFLPNDRPYRADVVQRMKDVILEVQTFFAEQMETHGYGRLTFHVETDRQGDPIVHRVDGRHPDSHYLDDNSHLVHDELKEVFDYSANIYLVAIDNSTNRIRPGVGGVGIRYGKQGGKAFVTSSFIDEIVAHELGHAFGLQHDFRDGEYIMSYGPSYGSGLYSNRLSRCHAAYLSVHPHFNSDSPIEVGDSPTINLNMCHHSYPPGSTSVPVRLKVDDPDGLHQVILHAAQPDNRWSVKSHRGLSGRNSAVIEFDYDGVIPSAHDPAFSRSTSLLNPLVHPIVIEVIDMNGDLKSSMGGDALSFVLFSESLPPLSKISGYNQHGLPNTPLPVPFVIEVLNFVDGTPRSGVPVTFAVTAGGGFLSVEQTVTDGRGRAASTLTLGPHLGTNTVEVSAAGIEGTVTFSAVAVASVEVDIPDEKLRIQIETALGKRRGESISSPEMAALTRLIADNGGISDLTGLEFATNLTGLFLRGEYLEEGRYRLNSNSLSNLSPLGGLTQLRHLALSKSNITDISSLSGLTNLTYLELTGNNITDISPLSGLTNLTTLWLQRNNISDIPALAELTNLTKSDLSNNNISDISPLSGLTYLDVLHLESNNITDLSALSDLTNLQKLWLNGNNITNLSALSSLTNLKELLLDGNNITDLSPLSSLNNLNDLRLTGNNITNLSPLSDLTNLAYLELNYNSISDLSPLVANTGLARRDRVYVGGNPLNSASINVHIPALRERKVEVFFDHRTPRRIRIVSGDAQQGLPGTVLDKPFVVKVQDQNGAAVWWVPVKFTVASGDGTLSVTGTETDRNGRAESTLTLGPHLGTNTVEASAAGIKETVTFSAVAVASVVEVDIPDENLRTKIETALGKGSGEPISSVEMATLTHLVAKYTNISDLTGLEYAKNLTRLLVINNNISDLSALSGLTNLKILLLNGNNISDLSALSDLTNLTRLELNDNSISDLSPLVANTGLARGDRVYVEGNPLNSASINVHIPTLESRGVKVEFDNRLPTPPLKISGDDQRSTPSTVLKEPLVVKVQGESSVPFEGVPITFTVTAGGGSLSAASVTTDSKGRAETTLTLGPKPGTNTVEVSAAGIKGTVTFRAVAVATMDVDILDEQLRTKIETALGKRRGEPISSAEMKTLTRLEAPNANISDLTGLEYATNLTHLTLSDEYVEAERRWINSNSVSDLSPLSGLTNLTELWLQRNNISDISALAGLTNLRALSLGTNNVTDISALAGLTNLTYLSLEGNSVADVSAVAGLTNLTELILGGNSITDISSVAGLTNLTGLHLPGNNISDISAVEGLTQLSWLYLAGNIISDISPLVANTGLGSGDVVHMSGIRLNYASIYTHIPALQRRGIDVTFDSRTPTPPLKISGDDQRSTPSTILIVVIVWDGSSVPFEGVPVTFTVTAGGGTLSAASVTTDSNGRAETTLTLGPNPGTNTVEVSAGGIKGTATFSAVAVASVEVDIADENLRTEIETALGKRSGEPISSTEIKTLTRLEAPNANISDLTGLEYATNLTELRLQRNNITDISALVGLTNLTYLSLEGNSVADVSAVAGLTNLTELILGGNSITDISPVAGLINLTGLHLPGNSISDISAVEGLTQLSWLYLAGNIISDISPLVANTGLGSGDKVHMTEIRLNYASIYTHIPALQTRGVDVTFDSRTPTPPQKICGDDQRSAPSTVLREPFVVKVQDESSVPFEGVPVTFTVTAGGGSLSAASVTTDSNGRAESTLTLGPSPGTNTVEVTVTGIEEKQAFNAEGIRIPKTLEIVSGTDQEGLPGEVLEKPFVVKVRDEFDNPLPHVEVMFTVTTGGGSLSATSVTTDSNGRAETALTLGPKPGTNTVMVSVLGIQGQPTFNAEGIQSVKMSMFVLSIPAGTHAIHIPLKVSQINGEDGTIKTVGDLYDALGDAVNFIISYIGGQPVTYLGDGSAGTVEDAAIGNDTGLIVSMKNAATLELMGDALGTGGTSAVNINVGRNLVGVPLDPTTEPDMISDLLIDGVKTIAVSGAPNNKFYTITAAGDPGDGPIEGGVGYIVVATAAGSIQIAGSAWENSGSAPAAPAIAFSGSQTPVLHVSGGLLDEFDMLSRVPELRVTVKNLSTGASIDTVIGTELSETAYSGTFVEFSRRAAKARDVLEIVAHSPNPHVGVRPVPQVVVSAEEVLISRMKLPDLELYEIPSETELLPNYPNPFNPETWIPYRLANAAEVTLDIYDAAGRLVRSIDVGFKPAAVYESRASAIYWDGRNDNGESVASGLYFYQLTTPSYRQLRRMVILK